MARMGQGTLKLIAASLVLHTSLVLSGCGVYSASSGRVDQNIQRVAVEYLENRTAQPDLGITMSELIIFALQQDNTLKVVDREVADSVIDGTVTHYRLRQASIAGNQQVDEYQVQIAVELTFRVKATGEAIFERRRFTGVGNYFLNDNDSDESTAQADAASEITKDVLAQVVEDW